MPRLLVLDESVSPGLCGILTAFEVKAARNLGKLLDLAEGRKIRSWSYQSLGYDQSRSRRDRSRVRRGRAGDIHGRQRCPTAPALRPPQCPQLPDLERPSLPAPAPRVNLRF